MVCHHTVSTMVYHAIQHTCLIMQHRSQHRIFLWPARQTNSYTSPLLHFCFTYVSRLSWASHCTIQVPALHYQCPSINHSHRMFVRSFALKNLSNVHTYVRTYIQVKCASTCYITTPHLVSCTGPSPWTGEMQQLTVVTDQIWKHHETWCKTVTTLHTHYPLIPQYSRLMLLPLPTPLQEGRTGRQDYHLPIAVASQPVSVHRIRSWCVQLLIARCASKRTYSEQFKRVWRQNRHTTPGIQGESSVCNDHSNKPCNS